MFFTHLSEALAYGRPIYKTDLQVMKWFVGDLPHIPEGWELVE